MEDKRYDPYTGYEIKDEDQRQEDQSRYENENMIQSLQHTTGSKC